MFDRYFISKLGRVNIAIIGRVDRASATEMVDLGLIPSLVKPKTIKIRILERYCYRCTLGKGVVSYLAKPIVVGLCFRSLYEVVARRSSEL